MNPKRALQISKFLSLVLRHRPDEIDLTLDPQGWASIKDLIHQMDQHGFTLSLEELKQVVANNDKQRFAFSEDLSMIRANQGHSVKVELDFAEQRPPAILFHGTAVRNLGSIQAKGLLKGKRHHVHLSADEATALKVGLRYGKPVILKIQALHMHDQGIPFLLSENGVWLTQYVAPQFIEFP